MACRVGGSLYPTSRVTESAVMARLKQYVEQLLGQYPSSREQDEEEAAQGGTSWCGEGRATCWGGLGSGVWGLGPGV